MLDFELDDKEYCDMDGGAFTHLDPVTVMFWFRAESSSVDQRLCGSDDAYECRFRDINTITNELLAAGGTRLESVSTLTDDVWYHLAFTANGTTNRQEIYIDGVLDASDNTTANDTPGTGTFSIGTRASITTATIDGRIEDFRIYSRVLTANEIKTIWAERGQDDIRFGGEHRYIFMERDAVDPVGSGEVKDLWGTRNLTGQGQGVNAPRFFSSELQFRE